MAQDPYRRPQPARPDKPRGLVVRRADEPEDLEQAERKRRDARYEAQSLIVRAEYEEARRATDRRARGAGALMILAALVLGAATVSSLDAGHDRPRTVILTPALLLVGVFSLAFGAGNAATFQSAPPWVKLGTAISFGLGLLWGVTGFVELLAMFTG